MWYFVNKSLGVKAVEEATVVFLGDYCDKGKNTKKVLDWLVQLRDERAKINKGETVFLAGNHDFAMAAYLDCIPVDNLPTDFDLDETINYNKQTRFLGTD